MASDNYVPNCNECQGTGQMRCPQCGGSRGQNVGPGSAQGTWQWVPCGYCLGAGTVRCTSTYGRPHTS
jgi:hypothetical protein